MSLLQDVFSLPGAVAAGLTNYARHNSEDAFSHRRPLALLEQLIQSIRLSRDPGDDIFASRESLQATQSGSARTWSAENAFHIPALKLKLQQAETYQDWHAAAAELDALQGHDAWKSIEECPEYDVALVRAKLREMDDVRLEQDQRKILSLMREGLVRNLGGMGSLRLYKHSRLGTKALIERYIESVLDTIKVLVDITKSGRGTLEPAAALQELLFTRQSFGRSALLLSGGGTFGMNHIGVIKALWTAKLLPRIISGASAGSIVSAVLCTRTDDEIPATLADFCDGDLAVFEKEGHERSLLGKAHRLLTEGSLFDIGNLTGVMKEILGDLTFYEAYNRTRRILNISVSAQNVHEMPRLLNYLTAPDVLIWSAVAASCSVPLIFSAAQLLVKDRRTGEHVPWNNSARRWIDGSVENDIPTQRLAEMFNVNHFIVSQVNPHVVPFLDKDEKELEKEVDNNHAPRTIAPTLAHKLSTMARDETMHRLQVMEELGILPNLFSKLRAVVGQKYAGDITIFPQVSYANFPKVLSNPDKNFMLEALLSGERATWPKLSEIRNHCAIELAIDDAVHELIPVHIFGSTQEESQAVPSSASDFRLRQLKRTASMRPLGTSPDLVRLAPRRQLHEPLARSAKSEDNSKKVAGPDLHDFSDSESDADEDQNGIWKLSAESSEDESGDTPPTSHQRTWPTRQLFPWASQPVTPNVNSSFFGITPLAATPGAPALDTPSTAATPSTAELQYKRIFHQAPVRDESATEPEESAPLRQRSVSSIALDPSGTRGMMRRRKLSVSIQLAQQ